MKSLTSSTGGEDYIPNSILNSKSYNIEKDIQNMWSRGKLQKKMYKIANKHSRKLENLLQQHNSMD